MPNRDIVVIGTSAGGVQTLRKVFATLPADTPATFFVAMHVQAHSQSVLPELLSRASGLPAHHPTDGEKIKHGRIYVAPPDYHLLLEPDRVRLSHGPKENRHRPGIDPLFRTAARVFGPRVIGVVLSGSLDDGTAGLVEICKHKGTTIVQDPSDAIIADMPRNALRCLMPDYCVPAGEMTPLLKRLICQPVQEGRMKRSKDRDQGTKPESREQKGARQTQREIGPPSMFVCPECNGPLWEIKNGHALTYRCLVGHSYGSESLYAAQSDEVEGALWVALRALEERVALQETLAERARQEKQQITSRRFKAKARENAEHAQIVRRALEKL
jgi:two-component system chemotaxis response regulator CheB